MIWVFMIRHAYRDKKVVSGIFVPFSCHFLLAGSNKIFKWMLSQALELTSSDETSLRAKR
jgi:hypothetical protein